MRALLAAIVILCGFCAHAEPASSIDFRSHMGVSKPVCGHEYGFEKFIDVQICSEKELTVEELRGAAQQVFNSIILYRKFTHRNKMVLVDKPIVVFIINHSVIQNCKNFYFEYCDDENVVARAVKSKQWIFVSDRVFTTRGYTDIPHEVAHILNGRLNVPPEEDEKLAILFETYYSQYMSKFYESTPDTGMPR